MKRLKFAFIIVLSLFFLGGCDPLLETFFPYDTVSEEYLDGETYADYSIAVTVEFASDLVTAGFGRSTNTAAKPIRVALIPFFERLDGTLAIDTDGIIRQELWQDTFSSDDDMISTKTTVEFNPWTSSLYKVLVWFDENKDGTYPLELQLTTTEPAVFALTDDGSEYWVDFSTRNPLNAGIDMNCRISMSKTVTQEQFFVNPYADTPVAGAGSTQPTAFVFSYGGYELASNTEQQFSSELSTYTNWMTNWEWKVKDPSGVTSPLFSGYDLYYTFDTIGAYTVSLRVMDVTGLWSEWVDYLVNVYQGATGTQTEVIVWEQTVDVQGLTNLPYLVPSAGQYFIHWEDSYESSGLVEYTGDVLVYAYDPDDIMYYFEDHDYGYYNSKPIYVSSPGTITISLQPYLAGSEGTCKVWITQLQ